MATIRDLVETITGLQKISSDLRECASGQPVEGMEHPTVLARTDGLLSHAHYIEGVVEELKTLIPADVVKVSEDETN